ncbi:glycoside hydrolase family 18 protein [Bacillus sp. CGMCC 1.16607]|uniref:glycoside hydrolase family 18 protein n=1 Tax=Bacillus sp. CGMCC 1.16607 TaxID=3351842 RepID=UPI00363886F4
MKKRNLLLTLVLLVTFIGGFITGVFYNPNHGQTTMGQLASSVKKPNQKQKPQSISKQKKVLIGYVQDFRNPDSVDYSKLTHVIFSFAHPTKDGHLLLNGDSALNNLRKTVSNAHKQHTKVMLAIGGWYHIQGGESYPYFKEAITNSLARTKLVDELVTIVDREQLDGIDIDFEHPRTKKDAENLTSFAKELSEKLQKDKKVLSIAVNAKVHSVAGTEINNVVFEPSMFKYVNHVNIMAYDGQWDGKYNAANLSPYSYNVNIVNYWSKLFDTYKISREKLVLGIPFYAQPADPAIKQVSYATIIKNNPANAKTDTVKLNGTTYYYNGEASVQKKTKLALDHGFGGMMLWEAGHDTKGPHSLTSAIANELEASNLYTLK